VAASTVIANLNAEPEPDPLEIGRSFERQITSLWWRLMREVPSELSRAAASVLVTLRNEGPQRVTALAAHENVTQPTMSTLIRRLERRGLVVRNTDTADRRACLVEVTEAGRVLMREREQARAQWLGSRLSALAPEEQEQVERALTLLDRVL
jgi:DNA-binding MarR family transcriptional regulator